MLKYGIDDIRLFHGNGLRFLRQFPWDLSTYALRVPLEKTEAAVIALEDLITLKRGVGRPRDLEDIAALESLANKVEESKEHPDE